MTTPTVAGTGAWTPVGGLPVAAAWYGQHDGAVVLDDAGGALVAGGADATGNAIDAAARYDPVGNKWETTGGLRAARRLHTITRLPDGSVMVTGGLGGTDDGGPGLPSVELYDPGEKTWTTIAPLGQPRWGHSATLLADGSVLVAGGSAPRPGGGVHALRSTELYDPVEKTWSPAAELTDGRSGHTAVPLTGGLVLVCGGVAPVGTAEDPALAFCELYHPGDDDEWTPTGSLRQARRHHAAAALSGTTVLITGGAAPGSPGTGPYDPFSRRTAEKFDATSGTWTAVHDMPAGRALHRAVPQGAGKVLVLGGAASDRDEAGYRSAVGYTATGDAWAPAAGLDTGRWGFAAAVLPSGKVLIAGGVARSGLAAADPTVTELTRTSELFDGTAGLS